MTSPPAAPEPATAAGTAPAAVSVGRASRTMAAGTLVSRATGFLRSFALVYVLGVKLVPDAYNGANTLPNMVYELLLGGILTSVFVPLITKAQREDPDGGEAYTQRLLTLTATALAAATVLAVLAAPLLLTLQHFTSAEPQQRDLAVTLARLLLPEIFFYGVASAGAAVLNTRGHFAAPMWAPILNNLVVLLTCGVFLLLPGPHGHALTPGSITTTQTLVLGLGTTFGIVVQAGALLPALRRVGFRWRWRFDWGQARLGEASRLAGWMLCYVAVSQIGVVVLTNLAVGAAQDHPNAPGYTTYVNAQLLFMLPHGIVAVSLINALMPRMSRAAVAGRVRDVVEDLSLGIRMSAVVLVPVTAAFIVLGPALTTVLFAHGATTVDEARTVGVVLANGALGLVVFAVSQLQIFAFYALRDTRTPALANVAVVGTKVVVAVLLAAALPAAHVVHGLMWANTASYAVGLVVTGLLLRRRLGHLGGRQIGQTLTRLTIAAGVGGLVAAAVVFAADRGVGEGRAGALVALVGGSAVGGAAFVAAAVLLRVRELTDALRTVRAAVHR